MEVNQISKRKSDCSFRVPGAHIILLEAHPLYNSLMTTRQHAQKILQILRRTYTRTPEDFVKWRNPLELTIATVLSAQCTDKKVNEVTAKLFKKYKTAEDYATAPLSTLEKEIKSTGFYRMKSKYLKGIGQILMNRFAGKVPRTHEELLLLPGVSFKSANLIMEKAFGIPTGVAVDTHVNRISPRLGLTSARDPNKKAKDLEAIYPKKDWLELNEFFILHGRAICRSFPRCGICPILNLCPEGKKRKKTGNYYNTP